MLTAAPAPSRSPSMLTSTRLFQHGQSPESSRSKVRNVTSVESPPQSGKRSAPENVGLGLGLWDHHSSAAIPIQVPASAQKESIWKQLGFGSARGKVKSNVATTPPTGLLSSSLDSNDDRRRRSLAAERSPPAAATRRASFSATRSPSPPPVPLPRTTSFDVDLDDVPWPSGETFAYDLAQLRRGRRASVSSESDVVSDGDVSDDENVEDATVTLRPPEAFMRARLEARRSRALSASAPLPNLSVALASPADNDPTVPQTAPLPTPASSSSDSLAARWRSFSDSVAGPSHESRSVAAVAGLKASPVKPKTGHSEVRGSSMPGRHSLIKTICISQPAQSAPSAEFVIGVIGPRGVGKTTVINRGLRRSFGKSVVLIDDGRNNQGQSAQSVYVFSTDPMPKFDRQSCPIQLR